MSILLAVSIGLGGAIGAALRAMVGKWIPSVEFPWATLLVNVSGSLLLAATLSSMPADSDFVKAIAGAGFCGAFTTFSTFILEVVILYREGKRKRSISYLTTTICFCILASLVGLNLIS